MPESPPSSTSCSRSPSQPHCRPGHSPASWAQLLAGRNGLRSIALAGGVALHAVNIYVVTTILPTIVEEIGGLDYYAWNTTLFVVASIVGSALAARLLGGLGPRLAYLLALAVFSLGSAACAMASSMPALLAGRCVQGLGGGVLFALSYALIRVVFEAPLWPRAMALVSGMWGVATLGGPAIGGIFAQQGLWRPAFWVLVPAALLLALVVAAQFRGKAAADAGSGALPWPALSLLVLSVLAICAASLSSSLAWNAVGMATGIALACLLVRVDGRSRHRLLPTGAYSLSAELGRLYALMGLLVAALTPEIFVPYFLQQLHGLSPLGAGYMTALMAGGWTLAALFSAGRGPRTAGRLIQAGPMAVLAALVVLTATLPLTGWSHPLLARGLYCLALATMGFGIGLCWPHLLTRVFSAALPGEEMLASSSITTVQLYATAMAAALAGMVANAAGLGEPGGLQGARSAAMAVLGTFALAPALALWLARPAKPKTTG